MRREIFSINFDFGTAMHLALEVHLRKNNPISVEHAVSLFRKKLEWSYKKNVEKYDRLVNRKELDALLKSGENILRNLHLCEELKNAEVVHNEYPLFEKIDRDDDVDMKFKGFIDIVIKTKAKNGDVVLYVCDFKTCSWGWDQETRQDRWKQFQLFLYKYYLCKKFDIDPKYVRTAFILLKKRPQKDTPPIEFFPVSAGPVSVQRAIDALHSNLTEMKSRIAQNSFKKNREQCIDKYGNVCPFYKTDHCT